MTDHKTYREERLKTMGGRIAGIEDRVLSNNDRLLETKRQMVFIPSAYKKRIRPARFAWGAAVAAVAAVLLARFFATQGDLTVRAAGRALREGDWISANAGKDTAIEFSDGSGFLLKSTSGMRIRTLHADGAHLLLEQGTVEADVKHRTDADWRMEVGPYVIDVTGTRFQVGWDPAIERFSLHVTEGAVDVTGPMIASGKRVGAGEQLHASLAKGRVEFLAERDTPPRVPTTTAAPSQTEPVVAGSPVPLSDASENLNDDSGETTAKRPAPLKRSQEAVTWQQLAERGAFGGALAMARKGDIEVLLKTASASELIALGDAARHTGEMVPAKRAYQQVRTRYPGSSHAASAAFALGIMAFDKKGAYREAAKWFKIIVAEQSGQGSLAKEAEGRLIEAESRAGYHAEARKTARHYLSRYPEGAHAALARRLCELTE